MTSVWRNVDIVVALDTVPIYVFYKEKKFLAYYNIKMYVNCINVYYTHIIII